MATCARAIGQYVYMWGELLLVSPLLLGILPLSRQFVPASPQIRGFSPHTMLRYVCTIPRCHEYLALNAARVGSLKIVRKKRASKNPGVGYITTILGSSDPR